MEFVKGNRVKCVYSDGVLEVGDIGTVLQADAGSVGVEWDRNVGGHSLEDRCEDGYGWWINPNSIELEGDVKMGKFKVGDYVVANEQGDEEYSITNKDAVLKVVAIDSEDNTEINLEVMYHKTNKSDIGSRHWVSAENFDLRIKKKKAVKKVEVLKKRPVAKDMIVMGKLTIAGNVTNIDTVNFISEGSRIITVTILVDGKAFMGVAKCDKHDRFIVEGGIALATSRAMRKMVDFAEDEIIDIL